MKPVRVIVFDAVGTLIHTRPSVAAIYHSVGQQFGSRLDHPTIAARFRELFAETFNEGSFVSGCGDATHRQLWQALVSRLFIDIPNPLPLFQTLWNRFADPSTWAVYPDVSPALTALRAAGHRLAIGSNFDSRLHRIVAGLAELHFIERVWTTVETGWPKPDRRFFDAIANSLAVAPQECLMVGDSLRDDVSGGTAAGWQAIHLRRGQATSLSGGQPSITSLDQLAGLLPTMPDI